MPLRMLLSQQQICRNHVDDEVAPVLGGVAIMVKVTA